MAADNTIPKGKYWLVGTSLAMKKEVYRPIKRVAPTRAVVLITGGSGTGKELAALKIHAQSPRAQKPFVTVNCGAIPEALFESEMFGHERGAFTGAVAKKVGNFVSANGGTLFLDEVGELTLFQQVKLLRALQEGEVRPVGAGKDVPVDVRVVAATNRDLSAKVRSGEFREDLFYRLNVFRINMPPLAERKEDIPTLVEHFLATAVVKLQLTGDPKTINPEALKLLVNESWPGNVRQLETVVQRMTLFADGPAITIKDAEASIIQSAATSEETLVSGKAPFNASELDSAIRVLTALRESRRTPPDRRN